MLNNVFAGPQKRVKGCKVNTPAKPWKTGTQESLDLLVKLIRSLILTCRESRELALRAKQHPTWAQLQTRTAITSQLYNLTLNLARCAGLKMPRVCASQADTPQELGTALQEALAGVDYSAAHSFMLTSTC